MRAALSMLAGLAVVLVLVVGAQAEDKKGEQTLKGTITCAKCDLKVADKCATVIKVTKDGKDTVYYLDDKSAKDNHKKICNTPSKGTVTGTVSEKDGKKTVKVSKIEFDS
jgi:hypothetical protein